MNKKKKVWQPSDADIAFIKKRYATYNSKQTITKTRILEKYGISGPLFDRFCARHGIKPKQPKAPQIKDFSLYQRIPVPDYQYGCVTYILVHPDKCPIEARERYIQKLKRNQRKPWETPKSVERAKKMKS